MKTIRLKIHHIAFTIICTILITFSCSKGQDNYSINSKTAQDTSERLSITFILGEDKEWDNPYYAQATNYYTHNSEGKTEYVITTCRSLVEVREFLTNNKPLNSEPWGIINLVSHGNQWLGLSVRVTPESKRASTERISQYIEDGTLSALPNSVIDENTGVFVHGCGVGNNTELLLLLAKAFRNADTIPQVNASRYFEYYTSVRYKGAIVRSEKYEARAWTVNYKMGYKPSDLILQNKLQTKYPDAGMKWQDALSRQEPRWEGDSYHYTFEVPVKWVIKYPDKASIPDVSTNAKKLQWIKNQTEVMEDLEKIEIEPEKFNWWFRTVNVRDENGVLCPAIWVKGYCTVLCVIQPIMEENKTELITQNL